VSSNLTFFLVNLHIFPRSDKLAARLRAVPPSGTSSFKRESYTYGQAHQTGYSLTNLCRFLLLPRLSSDNGWTTGKA
jgi:hypothetical protein